ncbi:CarboxypepD_reg-like domain-containing protein [Filimonas lacunae]|uniref:CarboxypepD_reg-like domain-containing protein n=1 Tax=Filimonas lacunae TaxID=477680 RepID=A0A173MKQ7_9BACT|nr:DUF5686 family protein [Filimonas lacunae]BAV08070.1 hypothetical protein FLA_4103 [Filimonas lacunae]SIT08842.1 CarboxypepD_reg-like domain-containing protein [Filimonas lacunae]
MKRLFKHIQPINWYIFTYVLFSFYISPSFAQQTPISGVVIHGFTKDPVTFASVHWKIGGFGNITDSIGRFTIKPSLFKSDTLLITFVGYKEVKIALQTLLQHKEELIVSMETAPEKEGAVVKTKFNKGLRWWKALVAHKKENAPTHYSSYYCELYNKLEIDISNLKKEQFDKHKLLKPMSFVWNDVDSTSEAKPFLPVFLTETLSDYYSSPHPDKQREEIKAIHTSGIKNESVMEYLGGMSQKVNTYSDYITLFGKEFISPASSVGDKYYNYKGADTQVINGEKYFHLLFSPRQEGENVFSGDCWLHSTSWALYRISLEASATANINFVTRLNISQEFTRLNEQQWVVAKDKFIVALSPFSKDKLSFIGRKSSTYRKVKVNETFIVDKLQTNNKREEVVIADSAQEQDKTFWSAQRSEPLSLNEQHAYRLIDTLRELPAFKKLSNTVTFIIDGHKKLGKIEIGPWYRWISGNQLEKLRLRFDLGTTEAFSKQLRLYGYLAYGYRDGTWKGQAAASWNLPGHGGWNISPSFIHDLDNGRTRFNDEDVTTDNMFSQLLRRHGIRQKFIRTSQTRLAITKTFPNNFSVQVAGTRSDFETFTPLPPKDIFSLNSKGSIVNAEASIKLRYAPGEKLIKTHRRSHSLKNWMPVTELKYSIARPNMMGSEYTYDKIQMSVSQNFRIPRWGQVSYMAYGGRVFGQQIPFMLLEIHPGNEIYYYSKDAFNLMNRFEYISDRYAGINLEHNFEKKLLNIIPFMRKTRMRQFWNFKTVWGNLGKENRGFNRIEYGAYHLRTLDGNRYTEVGTGLDNIYKFFRIDFVWRFAPPVKTPTLPGYVQQRFGVFGSFKLQF